MVWDMRFIHCLIPREVILKRFAKALAEEKGRMKEFALYELVESLAGKMIKEQRNLQKNVCANVDFYSGFVYSMLGIPQELFTAIFAIARMPGMERTPTGRVDKCEQNYPSGLQICGTSYRI